MADLTADVFDSLVDKGAGRPFILALADFEQEIGEDGLTLRAVLNFGMELDAVTFALNIANRRVG